MMYREAGRVGVQRQAIFLCQKYVIIYISFNESRIFTLPVTHQVYMTHEELYDDELLQYGGLEFPQINYDQHNGRAYRYFYSCGFGHVFGDSLLKMDVHTKELKVSVNQTSLRDIIVKC